VQQFVSGLAEQYRKDFAAILQLADGKNATGEKLGRIRNEFFHYPDLLRKTAERGKLPIMRALREGADEEGTISLGEKALGGIRAHFADELGAKLVMEHLGIDDEEKRALVKELGELQAAYGRFAQAALGRYLNAHGDAVTEVRD
jgi:hypothetical protein